MKYRAPAKDWIMAGGIAGIVGGIVNSIFGWTVKALGLTDRVFLDFSAILLAKKVFPGLLGTIVAILAHLAFCMILGIFFAYVVKIASSRYLLLKGFGFGFALWFFLSGLGTIFNLPKFVDIPPNSALTTLAGALLFGLVAAYTLRVIEQRSGLL